MLSGGGHLTKMHSLVSTESLFFQTFTPKIKNYFAEVCLRLAQDTPRYRYNFKVFFQNASSFKARNIRHAAEYVDLQAILQTFNFNSVTEYHPGCFAQKSLGLSGIILEFVEIFTKF